MKKLILLILLALAAGVWMAGEMSEDSGYLLIAYQQTTIEMSLWVGLGLVLLLAIGFYLLFALLRLLLASGDTARRWQSNYRRRRSLTRTNLGVIAYLEGNWAQAQKKLEQAISRQDAPLIGYIAAAQAAAKNQDFTASENYLKQAVQMDPSAALAVALASIEIQIQRKRYEQALAALLKLRQEHPKHPHVCKLLQEVYVALQDWEALGQLLPVMRKLKVAPTSELEQLERNTALFQLERAAKAKANAPASAQKLLEAWQRIPSKVRREESVAYAYSQQLVKIGADQHAIQALADAINAHWSERLVEQYGLLLGDDPRHQLLTAERWLQERNNSPVLMLALGRLSLRNKLWGKAREYFTSSIKLRSSVEACAEMGRLLHALGDQQGSSRYLQQSVELTRQLLPVLPLPPKQQTGS